MGTVYLADRDDDQFRKRVAIKLVTRIPTWWVHRDLKPGNIIDNSGTDGAFPNFAAGQVTEIGECSVCPRILSVTQSVQIDESPLAYRCAPSSTALTKFSTHG